MLEKTENIMGIDPGTISVGYGIIQKKGNRLTHLVSGTIKAGNGEYAKRLVHIHKELQKVINIYQPAVAAVETVFAGKNPKTSIAIGEGRGVAIVSAAEIGIEVVGYEPATVKKTVTGNGRATKEQMQAMVKNLLKLADIPESDHAADALGLAITCALHNVKYKIIENKIPNEKLKKLVSTRKKLPANILKQLAEKMKKRK